MRTFVVSFSNVCGVILLRIISTSDDSLSMGLANVFAGRATGCCRSFRDDPCPGPPWDDCRGGSGAGGPSRVQRG